MTKNLDHFDHKSFQSCSMSKDDIAAVYCFPLDEDFPVCLILYSSYLLIPALDELLDLTTEMEEHLGLILKIQVNEDKIEFHFDNFDEFAATLIITFLSSKPFNHFGRWAFKASTMPLNTKEVFEMYKDL